MLQENKRMQLITSLPILLQLELLTLSFPIIPLISLKTPENPWFSDVFRGIKREHWEGKG